MKHRQSLDISRVAINITIKLTALASVQSAKEEVIVELVDQCRINQHRVMQLVNITSYVFSAFGLNADYEVGVNKRFLFPSYFTYFGCHCY